MAVFFLSLKFSTSHIEVNWSFAAVTWYYRHFMAWDDVILASNLLAHFFTLLSVVYNISKRWQEATLAILLNKLPRQTIVVKCN